MKIIFNQNESKRPSGLHFFGISHCYFKMLQNDQDQKSITKKPHHHTGFEMHIVTEGFQEYAVGDRVYRLETGTFLLIYPNVTHTVCGAAPQTKKFSITFHFSGGGGAGCFWGKVSSRMADNLHMIVREAALRKEISAVLIENNILELLVAAFRQTGIKETAAAQPADEDAVLAIAKQYIADNICQSLSVGDVAQYCCMSTKQLTRIFERFEASAPGAYIKKQRVKMIETLLTDRALSLKQISEMMHFSSEYYFNEFFKKNAGLPPGAYRNALG